MLSDVVDIMENENNIISEEELAQGYKLPEFESRTFRFLAKYFPWPFRFALRYSIKKKLEPMDKVHEFFAGSEKVDIVPLESGERGFMIIIDRKQALYFYQDGDGFRYDGCEMGEYGKGDVTIFDNSKN